MAKKKDKPKNYTPQQIDFALYYYLPNSDTRGNAYASAKKAGYSETYAKSITVKGLEWLEKSLSEIVGKSIEKKNLVETAKRVLEKSLRSEDEKLAQDTAKFIVKTTPEFSEKQDITSGGEKLIPTAMVEFKNGKSKG